MSARTLAYFSGDPLNSWTELVSGEQPPPMFFTKNHKVEIMRANRRSPAARWLMSLLLMASLFSGLLVSNARATFSQVDAQNQKRQRAAVKFEALSRYADDLTELARREQIASVKGHDVAIRRIIKVLAQTERNNPVLIDDTGANRKLVLDGVA